jgi:hypothetical protein
MKRERRSPSMQLLGSRSRVLSESERRRHLRYSVQCQCWIESEQVTVFGPTADVGLGGLFLRTAVPLIEGQRVEVALRIGRKGQAVTAEGVVTRAIKAQHGLRHGVGVEFLRIVDGRDGLKRFLGARAQG